MRSLKVHASVCVALLAVTSFAGARELVLQTNEVVAQQKSIRADVEAQKGRYAKLTPGDRERILADQDKLFVLLDGTTSTNDLSENKKTTAFNLIDDITTTINDEGSDKRICTREAKTGSNFMTRVCRTSAQMRQEKEAADLKMKEANRKICNDRSKAC